MRIGIVAAVVCAALAGEARAETGGTVVFQLESANLDSELADIPEQLTQSIAKRIDGEASQATVADLALQLECSATQAACIDRMRRLVKADGVVWGKLAWNSYTRQLKVTLTAAVDDNDPSTTTYLLSSSKPGDIEDEVMGVAEGFLSQFDTEVEPPPPPPPPIELDTEETEATSGGVSGTTYVILGTGGAALATGIGFYALAYGYAQQWADAPVGTSKPELDDLESRRDHYWTISRVLLVGGAAIATWGIVRAVGEHQSPSVNVAPTLVDGGGGIAAFGSF
jgi:hypothetical protein